MSAHTQSQRLTAADIAARKGQVPLVCLTAYTAPMAQLLDPHCDVLLVGDSVGMVLHGMPDTVGVTLDMMILHAQAVMRGSAHALIVVDMPFGSYEGGVEIAYANAVQVLKETGAGAIKLESGPAVVDTVAYLTARGIPVMGHVGLRPQSIRVDGGFKVKGKTDAQRLAVLAEAEATAQAGAFALVIEGVPEPLAAEITAHVAIPTIGIGASAACDGQILVTEDLLGLSGWSPKFVKRYADVGAEIDRAIESYAADVRARAFPAAEHTYKAPTRTL
jgi:3-methyl-2-oxobutanoate hydroxymethyltransferase